ncbi:hypothetical protein RchiOBHm_Chr6g0244401 [Rosa chinensis]|uniref:Uncharacterized protein n=1 Tax=Rosa chinensis TaxID=74649 RepID=A0A2P6PJ11_ROSCH|nr:hypothetical protein RchiOBHm_Chr6g0244401 [Rosa chinensis]
MQTRNSQRIPLSKRRRFLKDFSFNTRAPLLKPSTRPLEIFGTGENGLSCLTCYNFFIFTFGVAPWIPYTIKGIYPASKNIMIKGTQSG